MSTLLNNAKLFLKASVPVTIPAVGVWKFSSKFSLSLHLPHLHQYLVALDWKCCESSGQEIFCWYFYLCSWLFSEIQHLFILATSISLSVCCLFIPFAHFSFGLSYLFVVYCKYQVFIIWIENIFSIFGLFFILLVAIFKINYGMYLVGMLPVFIFKDDLFLW